MKKRVAVFIVLFQFFSFQVWGDCQPFIDEDCGSRPADSNSKGLVEIFKSIKGSISDALHSEPRKKKSRQGMSEIEILLDSAAQDERAQRLTTPEGRSAVSKYRAVLKLEPGNASARAGIRRIANTYLRWAKSNLQRNRLEKTQLYAEKANQLQSGIADELLIQAGIMPEPVPSPVGLEIKPKLELELKEDEIAVEVPPVASEATVAEQPEIVLPSSKDSAFPASPVVPMIPVVPKATPPKQTEIDDPIIQLGPKHPGLIAQ